MRLGAWTYSAAVERIIENAYSDSPPSLVFFARRCVGKLLKIDEYDQRLSYDHFSAIWKSLS